MVVLRSGENPRVTEAQLESAVEVIESFLAEEGFRAELTIDVQEDPEDETMGPETVIEAAIPADVPPDQVLELIGNGNIRLSKAGLGMDKLPIFFMPRLV
jgi:hypothetical protein